MLTADPQGALCGDDVLHAREQLKGVVVPTPCMRSSALSSLLGAGVGLKLENLQVTGSFKSRGAYVKMNSLSDAQRHRGVIAASAGNHGQAVAHLGARLGVPATIVMPVTTPYLKVRRTEQHGARVLLRGKTFFEAAQHAREVAQAENLTVVPPYDDRHIIAGQGTVAVEMLESDEYDAIVVPVGGGGLISGVALAVKHLSPRTDVIGVRVEHSHLPTLAEGIAVKELGEIPEEIIRRLVDDMLFVDEPHLERAVHLLLEEEKLLVEGAGAAPLAALLRYPQRFAGKRVGLIVSGGNLDTGLLASVILRVRFQEGRVARIRVQIVDAPGTLVQIARAVAQHHANVLEVSHHRSFSGVPAKCAELDLTIEMRHPRDIDAILSELREASFETTLLTGGACDV
jgi:threonine dehydratase